VVRLVGKLPAPRLHPSEVNPNWREVFPEFGAEAAPPAVAPEEVEVAETIALRTQMPMVGDARALLSSDRERAASILLGDDNGAGVLENIRRMAMAKQRSNHWASLYAEIVGWTGTKAQLLAWIMGQLGVSMLAAQDAVKQIQRVPNDPHEIAKMCSDYLAWYSAPGGPGADRKQVKA
jgi:hypothetical protein